MRVRLTHCKRGHKFTAKNTLVVSRGARGGTQRKCRTCNNATRRRYQPKIAATTLRRWRRSPAAKASRQRYLNSPKGKAKHLASVRRYNAAHKAAIVIRRRTRRQTDPAYAKRVRDRTMSWRKTPRGQIYVARRIYKLPAHVPESVKMFAVNLLNLRRQLRSRK